MPAGIQAIKYRAKAVELREMAKQFSVEQIRNDTLMSADEWERLAERVEKALAKMAEFRG